jgi:hypothetical protein
MQDGTLLVAQDSGTGRATSSKAEVLDCSLIQEPSKIACPTLYHAHGLGVLLRAEAAYHWQDALLYSTRGDGR